MKLTLLLFLVMSLFSCGQKTGSEKEGDGVKPKLKENMQAKELLQGVWYDDDSGTPLLLVKGDTLRFIDQSDSSMEFMIVKDSLYTYGYDVVSYKIDKQSPYEFWFHSLSDRIVKLYKSENLEDSLFFMDNFPPEPIPIYTEVVQKDSVVFYNDRRYRGYVYINPSTMKVNKPTYSDEGIRIDNIFYDNVIHICVYEGQNSLFARDVLKKDFQSLVTDTFYEQAVLADMDFDGVDKNGYHFTARLGIPESFTHNLISVTISFEGKMSLALKELKME
ncbi:hypothetical protein Bcop_1023 [Bacteroides coprosuis DSM 18011]|uniref:Lipoprotein n=1 Tax=Bacteroides coprosuis DSM 18011 TaxID=679937 RepID=F3ZTJ9_9BACE|nr:MULTISPECIES: DUF4738 domain-containing protein [Bacteroides]EGJ71230.1 hypothetical protein Bcop_1023 [Bacteroides coprosuis DSM 18011]HJD92998.1 DUF4738 domain-containing protein [Bacteroides coprosuis]